MFFLEDFFFFHLSPLILLLDFPFSSSLQRSGKGREGKGRAPSQSCAVSSSTFAEPRDGRLDLLVRGPMKRHRSRLERGLSSRLGYRCTRYFGEL